MHDHHRQTVLTFDLHSAHRTQITALGFSVRLPVPCSSRTGLGLSCSIPLSFSSRGFRSRVVGDWGVRDQGGGRAGSLAVGEGGMLPAHDGERWSVDSRWEDRERVWEGLRIQYE